MLVLGIVVGPALASGAQKVPLFNATFFVCPGGASGGTATGSVAIVQQQDARVIANIQLKDEAPSTTFDVFLEQTPNCPPVLPGSSPNTLTTNSQGHGHAKLSEPLLPGATGAFVLLLPRPITFFLASPNLTF